MTGRVTAFDRSSVFKGQEWRDLSRFSVLKQVENQGNGLCPLKCRGQNKYNFYDHDTKREGNRIMVGAAPFVTFIIMVRSMLKEG